jgi:hypothetical protein
MKALIKKIKFYCKFLFRLNYYKGIDKLTFTDWLYKSRLGFKDVKELYEIIYTYDFKYESEAQNETN